jgi:hypothetical protein
MAMFKKRRGMIDVRELQRKGIVPRTPDIQPSQEIISSTNSEGFVDFTNQSQTQNPSQSIQSTSQQVKQTTDSFVNFFNMPQAESPSLSTEPTQSNSEDLRKISAQLSNLDNQIYKLEQRIEVLERKTGVGNTPNSTGLW